MIRLAAAIVAVFASCAHAQVPSEDFLLVHMTPTQALVARTEGPLVESRYIVLRARTVLLEPGAEPWVQSDTQYLVDCREPTAAVVVTVRLNQAKGSSKPDWRVLRNRDVPESFSPSTVRLIPTDTLVEEERKAAMRSDALQGSRSFRAIDSLDWAPPALPVLVAFACESGREPRQRVAIAERMLASGALSAVKTLSCDLNGGGSSPSPRMIMRFSAEDRFVQWRNVWLHDPRITPETIEAVLDARDQVPVRLRVDRRTGGATIGRVGSTPLAMGTCDLADSRAQKF